MKGAIQFRATARKWFRRAALVIGTVLAGAIAWVWLFSEVQRQDQWIRTAALALAAWFVFLLWVVFASGWRPVLRWSVFVGTLLVLLVCRFTLRITGVTGDMLPIVQWRWKQAPAVTANVSPFSPRSNSELKPPTNSYPQFLGPARNGVVPGPALERDWTQTPPRELWRRPVGAAWSGFAIADGRAITQEQRDDTELVVCYELLTGAPVWSHEDNARYATTIAGEGPRATPTIDKDRVFTLGGTGILNCLETGTGRLLWTTNTLEARGAPLPDWGVACSPLVVGEAVIVTVGGEGSTLVAYDTETGALLWRAGNDGVHWSSPVRAEFQGTAQIVSFTRNVFGHDEQTGRILWQYPWRGAHPHVTTPLPLSGDRLLVSSGYGTGSELLQIVRENDRWKVRQLWKSIRLKSKFANLIHHEGYLYGLDDGALVCLDLEDGALKWKGERYGHGQMLLVGGLLLLMAEKGDLVLLEPSPVEQRELTRFKVFEAKTWNPPALAGDLLVLRNDREAACLRLPVKP